MKKNYIKAKLTLILMDAEDIVATSGGISLANFNAEQQDQAKLGDLLNIN